MRTHKVLYKKSFKLTLDLLTSRARGGGSKNKFAVAHPIPVSNAHTKFGKISPNGSGGDSITEGWVGGRTDGWTEVITISSTLL